jgi:hypothetical protein
MAEVILCVMVIVLAIEPKVCGFRPHQERWILRVIKIRSMTSFGGEIKLLAPCCKTLLYVKDLIGKIEWPFLVQFLPASLQGVSATTRTENCCG